MRREIFPCRTRERPRASWQSANTRLKCLFSSCCVLKLDVKDSVQFGVEHSHQVDGSYDTEPTGRKWSSKRHLRCFSEGFSSLFIDIYQWLVWHFLLLVSGGFYSCRSTVALLSDLSATFFYLNFHFCPSDLFFVWNFFFFKTTIQSLLWMNATTVGLTSLPIICPYSFFLPFFFFLCDKRWP